MAGSPRLLHTQQTHYLRKTITFADDNDTVTVGYIPSGALVLKPLSGVAVVTPFDGTAPQLLDIGPSTNTDLWATDLSLSTAGFTACDENVSFRVESDTEVQCVLDVSAAAAGEAEVVIAYIPDNDG